MRHESEQRSCQVERPLPVTMILGIDQTPASNGETFKGVRTDHLQQLMSLRRADVPSSRGQRLQSSTLRDKKKAELGDSGYASLALTVCRARGAQHGNSMMHYASCCPSIVVMQAYLGRWPGKHWARATPSP